MVASAVKLSEVTKQHLLNSVFKRSPTATLVVHTHRGNSWPIIYDELNSSSLYLNELTYNILIQLDDNKTLQQILTTNAEINPNHLEATLVEIIKLYQYGLVLGNLPILESIHQKTIGHTNLISQLIRNPFSQKIPLLDSDKRLHTISQWLTPFLTPGYLILTIVFILMAIVMAIANSDELLDHFNNDFQQPNNLLLLALLYLPMKALHEIAHGITAKKLGANTGKFGLVMFAFFPIPYVDVSSSARFTKKSHRMLVASAGILTELTIAAIALVGFVVLNDGWFSHHYATSHWIKSVLFNLIFIGFASSLLFNVNPLLRFDGYYILSDWLELPNLATRSRQLLSQTVQKVFFGIRNIVPPRHDRSETKLLLFYAVASFIYRIVIFIVIVRLVTAQLWWLGFLLFILGLTNQWLIPGIKNLLKVFIRAQHEHKTTRFLSVISSVTTLAIVVIFFIPIQQSTVVNGVLDRNQYWVRANSDGFIAESFLEAGSTVSQGDLLFSLNNPSLTAEHKQQTAKLNAEKIKYQSLLFSDSVAAQTQGLIIENISNELNLINDKIENSHTYSHITGVLEIESTGSLLGRFVSKGESIANVVNKHNMLLDVLIHQQNLVSVKDHLRKIEVIPLSLMGGPFTANIVNIVPKATQNLPSDLFTTKYGGGVKTKTHDGKTVSDDSWFVVKISVSTDQELTVIPQRWQVRFFHNQYTIAQHGYLIFSNWFLDHML
ncbi:hypothetical protein NBRC116591_08640 [Sessilibacter corallicola]|uniref:Peptide zinc metalloprotease protein n=1 Tax=Sessilibacter corallicola TaxID=2904075 RepID=A0ABQ0A5X6_9GAMM